MSRPRKKKEASLGAMSGEASIIGIAFSGLRSHIARLGSAIGISNLVQDLLPFPERLVPIHFDSRIMDVNIPIKLPIGD